MCGFPDSGMPALKDNCGDICINTLYSKPLKQAGFIIDVVGANRLLGALTLGGALTGVTSLNMAGALAVGGAVSGVTSLTMTGDIAIGGSVGSTLARSLKGWFKDLEITNIPTVGGFPIALISDLARYLPLSAGAVLTTGNQSIAGIKTLSDATEASSATVGGTIVSGGLAVAKRVYATDMTVTNKITGSISGNADGSAATATTAGNLSGTPALPNGTTATTQAAGSNDTKLATDAYADAIGTARVKNDGTVNPTNLLSNGDFENWSAGTTVAPDGWTLGGANATVAREASTIKLGTYSAKLTRVGADGYLGQTVHLARGIGYWKGRTVTFGCWVYATVASRARIRLSDGIGEVYSSYHTGDSTWQWLTITETIASNATAVGAYCWFDTGNTTCYFDGAMCVEGESAFAFADKPAIDPGIATGGSASAGAGKQYVVIRIGGVNYKVLHDGTI